MAKNKLEKFLTNKYVELAGVLAGGYLLWRRWNKKQSVSGIGAVDNEWGANEMYLWVMNTESLYNRYREKIAKIRGWYAKYPYDQNTLKKMTVDRFMTMLQNDIKYGYIPMEPGMGKGEKARRMAAEDLYNSID